MMNNIRVTMSSAKSAQNCINWLKTNVGPQLSGVVGTVVRGEGWMFYLQTSADDSGVTSKFNFELNEHVDDETAVEFLLKYS